MFNGTFRTNRLYHVTVVGNISHRDGRQHGHIIKQYINQENNKTLFGLGFLETITSLWLGFLRGVFLANHLASTDYLTRTTKKTEYIATKTNNTYKGALINNNTISKAC